MAWVGGGTATMADGLITVPVPLGGGRSYDVLVGAGARHRLLEVLPLGAHRAAVVTQEAVGVTVDAGVEQRTFLMGDGEAAKCLESIEELCRAFSRWGLTRRDVVVAVGGGVVTDAAGFAAAVYHRGVPVVHVPTTLLAQVDAAIGGKTGVNLPEGKNLVGAYHQPSAVFTDPSALATLPPEEHAAGYAEVVKTALIAGGALWGRVRQGGDPDEDVILACVRTKLAVVAADERDDGRRQVLNLGHTVGHAIEAAAGYAVRHGEAVGLGLLCALRLSGREALRSEVAELLRARGLPLHLPGAAVDDVVALVARDKKRRGGAVPFVLVEAPGHVRPGCRVPDDELRAALQELAAG